MKTKFKQMGKVLVPATVVLSTFFAIFSAITEHKVLASGGTNPFIASPSGPVVGPSHILDLRHRWLRFTPASNLNPGNFNVSNFIPGISLRLIQEEDAIWRYRYRPVTGIPSRLSFDQLSQYTLANARNGAGDKSIGELVTAFAASKNATVTGISFNFFQNHYTYVGRDYLYRKSVKTMYAFLVEMSPNGGGSPYSHQFRFWLEDNHFTESECNDERSIGNFLGITLTREYNDTAPRSIHPNIDDLTLNYILADRGYREDEIISLILQNPSFSDTEFYTLLYRGGTYVAVNLIERTVTNRQGKVLAKYIFDAMSGCLRLTKEYPNP